MVFPSSNHTPVIKSQLRKSVKVTPTSALCKCLFGRPDPESNDISNLTKEVISKEQRRFKRKWNFDVEKLSPVVIKPSNSSGVSKTEVLPTTPKKVVDSPVAPSLAQVASQFKWEKLENENIPYFYYKPAQGSFNDRMRPLTCRNSTDTVPCTPVKRRYQDTELYEERRTKMRSNNDAVKSFKIFDKKSPTARRLDFDAAAVPQSPKKQPRTTSSNSTLITQQKIRAQQQMTQLRLPVVPILMKEDFVKLGGTMSPTKTPKRQNKKQLQQQDKKNEASPRSQKLITEMMFIRRVRNTPKKMVSDGGDKTTPVDTGSSSEKVLEVAGPSTSASNSSTPFGSPVTRRISSSQ